MKSYSSVQLQDRMLLGGIHFKFIFKFFYLKRKGIKCSMSVVEARRNYHQLF